MQNNNLTGKLPENYPLEMPHLADLNVQGNQLQGAVPATWQNWGSLKTVYAPALDSTLQATSAWLLGFRTSSRQNEC